VLGAGRHEPNDLRDRVADAIFENIDPDPWQRAELVERAERESFIRVMAEWRRSSPNTYILAHSNQRSW
jgi:hypothetical protein